MNDSCVHCNICLILQKLNECSFQSLFKIAKAFPLRALPNQDFGRNHLSGLFFTSCTNNIGKAKPWTYTQYLYNILFYLCWNCLKEWNAFCRNHVRARNLKCQGKPEINKRSVHCQWYRLENQNRALTCILICFLSGFPFSVSNLFYQNLLTLHCFIDQKEEYK